MGGGKGVDGEVVGLARGKQVGPQIVFRQGEGSQRDRRKPGAPSGGQVVGKHRKEVAFGPAFDDVGYAFGLQGVPSGGRVNREQPGCLGMGGAERLHHGDGLFQFAEACHVEPHERGAAVGETPPPAPLVSDGDARLGPSVLAKRQQTQQP